MPKEVDLSHAIVGDVVAVTEVTVNTKGGSMTAILKKVLRERLGRLGNHLPAAVLQFTSGPSLVLLSSGTGESCLRVHRMGENRFEIALDDGEDEEVDDLTAAFLRLKESQFKAGSLPLMAPVTADEWRADMDEKLKNARRAARALSSAGTPSG